MTNNSKNKNRILRLTVSALLIALSTILSTVKLFQLPQGGSVTALSMVPLVLLAMLYGTGWGVFACFAHGLLQLLLGLGNLRGMDTVTLLGSIFLDYILAFTVIGLAGLFRNMKSKPLGAAFGAALGAGLRFICHFLSGWLLWSEVTMSWAAVASSLVYNGSYMLPELVFTCIAAALVWPTIDKAAAAYVYRR